VNLILQVLLFTGSIVYFVSANDQPLDIDQLVTVKGLLIRTSPVIPDLKQGIYSLLYSN
jgi:SRSO17 transposase